MSNNPPPGQHQQHMMSSQHNMLQMPTMPGMMMPPAALGMLPQAPGMLPQAPGMMPPDQQQLYFQQMMASGQRAPLPMLPTGQQTQNVAAYMRAMQSSGGPQMAQQPFMHFAPPSLPRPSSQAQAAAASAVNERISTGAAAGGGVKGTKGGKRAAGATQQQQQQQVSGGQMQLSSSTALPRRRRAEASVKDEKPHRLLADSPLFVSLQDEERRVEAMLSRKRLELQEAFSAVKRGPPGQGAIAGSVRKRLRLYIAEQRRADPVPAAAAGGGGGSNLPARIEAVTLPGSNPHLNRSEAGQQQQPAWMVTISGRVVDPDGASSHPGGGGSEAPSGEDPREKVPRQHHFTHYVRKLTVTMHFAHGGEKVVTWERHHHDRLPRDAFTVRRAEDRPEKVTVVIEVERSPGLLVVTPAVEELFDLAAGPSGGTYSEVWLAQKFWAYAFDHGLLQGPEKSLVRFNSELVKALDIPEDEPAAQGVPQTFAHAQRWLKAVCSAPGPITLVERATLPNDSTTPHVDCVDVHYEVPLQIEGAMPERLAGKLLGPDKSRIDELDEALSATLTKQRESKRRRTVLASFAAEPALFVHELIKLYGREVRVGVTREGAVLDQGEVMRSGDAYGERWVPDAAQRHMAALETMQESMQAAMKERQRLIQQEVMAQAAMIGAGGGAPMVGGAAPPALASPAPISK